jgi:Putative Ig domain
MRSSWRSAHGAQEQRIPVEMRFVDMFMTALGSLIFLALLLSVLVAYIDKSGPVVKPPEKGQPAQAKLRLLTASLPPGRVDEPYDLVLAHRGGVEPLTWSMIAGPSGLPGGIAFNEENGAFVGSPRATGSYPVTVVVVDSRGAKANASYYLNVAPRAVTAQQVNLLIASALLLALLWFARKSRQRVKVYGIINRMATEAKNRGQTTLNLQFSATHQQQRELSEEGLRELRSEQAQARKTFRLEVLAVLAAVAYLCWAVWKAEITLPAELVSFVQYRWPGILVAGLFAAFVIYAASRKKR